jgi:hypothetical protein
MSIDAYLSFLQADSGSSFLGKIEKGQFNELMLIRKKRVD